MTAAPRRLLVLSQVYVPDPAAVGQYMADAACEMVRRGWDVVVFTSARGYDDTSARYPSHEIRDGVHIRRLPATSFGKGSLSSRLIGALSFVLQSIVHALSIGRLDVVLVSTSPPMASLAALAIARLKRARLKFWVMDVNPDQIVALGGLKKSAWQARLLEWLNRRVLARASDVIVLDRYMAERIVAKRDVRGKLTVIPPWPQEEQVRPVARERNPFRRAHGLDGKLVVLYSGNHGPTHPVTTVLDAARLLVDEPRVVFVFVGGGVGKREVEAARLPNVLSLPYQPLEVLSESLSAGDVHVVTMGDGVVGISHPSKVYGALAAARPIVLVGPERSAIGDLLQRDDIGWSFAHGDARGLAQLIRSLVKNPDELVRRGERAHGMIRDGLSRAALCGKLCDVLER